MKNSYTAPWRKLALTALLGLGGAAAAQAQLNFPLGNAANTAGTYTDLGTTGTVITTPNNDDANSAVTPIGFTFSFNGASFTDFVLNTNGYLKLGTTAPGAPYFYSGPQAVTGGPLNTAAETNLILPFNLDLEGTTTTEYRVLTTGATGERVTTIQWKNVSDKLVSAATGKQFASISFQVKLYETSNRVEFVYGTATAGPGPDAFKSAAIGLKGSGNTASSSLLVTKGSVQTWNLASFVAGNYTGNAHNVRSSALPDAGRTYSFTPQQANDAAVSTIYTLGKLPVPFNGAHTVRALVRNVGSTNMTNIAVTLNVSGSTTFSDGKIVATLGVGDSTFVTFNAYTPTTVGTNTVRVAVGTDNNTVNNAKTVTQLTTADAITYVDAETSPSNFIYGGTVASILANRHSLAQSRTVTNVKVNITNDPTRNTGRSVYGVVLDAQGNIIGRSADRVLTAADNGTQVTFPITTPPTIPAGKFFIGIGLVVPTGAPAYYPLEAQQERPTRPDTAFFAFPVVGGVSGGIDNSVNYDDRFRIEATLGTPLGTSAALSKAVSMFPNPSTGVVTLDVRGANAKNNLQVSVMNMLGQTVHTASLKDNFENQLNLSGLANGVYLLKVQTGSDFTTRQLTIAK
ncbi:T9SS type A sorting domain-containing protein [Hymenobacter psychrotolerans]|uniref:Por secretion system C-terminal sorting domain-containing protein n=1 Tax=Hymenobacter psychrotolerans DSM 18569 TaxID=1121959 RepID=A0A1M6YQX1_9BACT|nr:T9SS type A sorting domain-containing protein [Hymenobacter psychrotolerans]SHL20648.1 Por secretion system C-terminal sorting domain-containing protein [Hymenobacter psychrotolerans DSM 18569]